MHQRVKYEFPDANVDVYPARIQRLTLENNPPGPFSG